MKIWRPDGTILYATQHALIGRKFESSELTEAARGRTVFAYEDHDEPEDLLNCRKGDQILEIYLPIHDSDGKVIAVGEFYQNLAVSNRAALTTIQGSWLIRLLFLVLGLLVLFVLVRAAHNTIIRQQIILKRNYVVARRLARQNLALRATADETRLRSMKANEELLSIIGAELHDGPIQLLSAAMLNPPEPPPTAGPAGTRPAMDWTTATSDAISQLRIISSGLILPEIEELSAEEAVRLAIVRHERMTGTEVESVIGELPPVAQGLKAAIYRIVQECLNNATRYAGGKGQRVEVDRRGEMLRVEISDRGPGMNSPQDDGRPRLGILGARNRVEAFGGRLDIESTPGKGTRVVAVLPIEDDEAIS